MDQSPVTPLGHCGEMYFFLSASGERRAIKDTNLEAGRGVLGLFAECDVDGEPVEEWLAKFFPPLRDRGEAHAWSRKCAGEWLIRECHKCGLYDPNTEIRGHGVWRFADEAGDEIPLAHCGEVLISPRRPSMRAGSGAVAAMYPKCHKGAFPATEMLPGWGEVESRQCEVRDELAALVELIEAGWSWERPVDARIVLGWLGCALLGAYPAWRPHLWIYGESGGGKSELIKLLTVLSGPLCPSEMKTVTAAGLRTSRNGQALPAIFDEFELSETNFGNLKKLIETLRNLSDNGEITNHGGNGGKGVSYRVRGAASLASIMPMALEPQDANRFVMVRIGARDQSDPGAAARRLCEIKERAARLRPKLWLHALFRAAVWDRTFDIYKTHVQAMGGRARDGDTIGAVLAGHDLLFSPLEEPDDDQIADARDLAEPLLLAAREAAEKNEGQRCLDWLMWSPFPEHSESRHIRELIEASAGTQDTHEAAKKKLGRLGMRYRPKEQDLVVVVGTRPLLNDVFRSEPRWKNGGHATLLRMLDGVTDTQAKMFAGGRDDLPSKNCKVLSIPLKLLPIDPAQVTRVTD